MAVHISIDGMVQEALIEKYVVSQFCIEYRKDPSLWGSQGCFGYPAAVLLLSVADTIGSYVVGGNTQKHFTILNHADYYNLELTEAELKVLYDSYRGPLTHNSAMPMGVILAIGQRTDKVIAPYNNSYVLNLVPFLDVTKKVLEKFLPNANDLVTKSRVFKDLMKKGKQNEK